jgi:hypothetical protein
MMFGFGDDVLLHFILNASCGLNDVFGDQSMDLLFQRQKKIRISF